MMFETTVGCTVVVGNNTQVIDWLHVGLNEQQHRLFKDLNLQSRKVIAGLNPALR